LEKLENKNNKKINLTVVIMAFNEESTIREVYEKVKSSLNEIGGENEIIIVNDGSTDGTKEIINSAIEGSKNNRTINYLFNRGLGSVYRTGFEEAKGKFVTFFPADGQFPASEIKEFYKLNIDADLVLGYLPKLKRSAISIFLSKIERLIYKILFGEMPQFQGLFMFKRQVLESFELVSEGRGWAIVMELIIRVSRNGGVIKNLPGTMFERKVGNSKVNNFKTIWSNLAQIYNLRKVFKE